MRSSLDVRRSSVLENLRADRAAGKALAAIQTAALLERANDVARRNLSLGRTSDLGIATRHALNEGDEIVRDLAARLENNPFGARVLIGIAEEGANGIRREIRHLSEGI